MKTKPHTTRPDSFANRRELESPKYPTSFSAQKPKVAILNGNLRNHLASLAFCFNNNDPFLAAFLNTAAALVPTPKTPGDQGINQNREPLTRRVIPWRFQPKNKR